MKKFRDYFELNESPEWLGDTSGLQSKEDFKDIISKEFNNISNSEKKNAKKLFGDFKFLILSVNRIKNKVFCVFRDELDLFIVFDTNNKTFNVKIIRNISNERNLSFKCYRAILDLTSYNEITTGDALSLDNIKAHKKALSTFKIYVRNKHGDKEIENKNEFDYYDKRSKSDEIFVLKESYQFLYLSENLNTKLDEYIEFYMN